MNRYPTPHINASPEDFGETVLMPGDPLRAKFIAQQFLEQAKLVNNVRGIQGYTGWFEGTRLSVMASGMGMPSMGIYAYELFHVFNVKRIIRVGTAGGLHDSVKLRDIVLGLGACTDSGFARQYRLPGSFAPTADFDLLQRCCRMADRLGLADRLHVGTLLSSDTFYKDEEGIPPQETAAFAWKKMGVLAVEMEAAALYMTAARCGKKALAICTVSDHVITGEKTGAEEREKSFTDMMLLALQTAKDAEGRN